MQKVHAVVKLSAICILISFTNY